MPRRFPGWLVVYPMGVLRMAEPLCPNCGAEMVLRTARRGKYIGQSFYGCSRYPICKAISRPWEHNSKNGGPSGVTTDRQAEATLPQLVFPRRLMARPLRARAQVCFFETAALPDWVLSGLSSTFPEGIPDLLVREFSQWRVDFPKPAAVPALDTRKRQVLAVCDKILTRGRLTLISPAVQPQLEAMFHVSERDWAPRRGLTLAPGYTVELGTDTWFDSQEEALLASEILPRILGDGAHRWVIPQVELSSLISATDSSLQGRVDFLVHHPGMAETVVIEVDGEQHQAHGARDARRDRALEANGFRVLRIPAGEVGNVRQPATVELAHLWNGRQDPAPVLDPDEPASRLVLACKAVHQIQLVIVQALKTGFLDVANSALWQITADLEPLWFLDGEQKGALLRIAVDDFLELARNISALYLADFFRGAPAVGQGQPSKKKQAIHISYAPDGQPSKTFHVRDILAPYRLAQDGFPASPAALDRPSESVLRYFLKYLFRKDDFWEGQYEVVSRALQGLDVIVLLPTGGGKSIAFQLASMLLPGRTIVIDPIISLVEDQIDNLGSYGIDRCMGITSQIVNALDREQAAFHFGQGEYLFTYVTPERFQIASFRESLATLTAHTPVSLITIDEAHCVSEWGHDFRTAYLNIGRISRSYCRRDNRTPPLLALTGTASKAVLKDVQRELGIEDFDAIITPKSFDRPELRFQVVHCRSHEKAAKLKGLLGQSLPAVFGVSPSMFFQPRGQETYCGLVFCPHVKGDYGVVSVAATLGKSLGIRVPFYSGSAPSRQDRQAWDREKSGVSRQFKRSNTPLLVATKAFGMGIDKPNIRYSVHFGMPASLEAFYQEAGRAGRDRRTAQCVLLVSDDNPTGNRRLLEPATGVEEIERTVKDLPRGENDDVTRMLYFHTQAFRGISEERKVVLEVLKQLPDLSRQRRINVMFKDIDRDLAEKGLHRLILIGVVEDYTIDYASNEFAVQLSGNGKEEIIRAYGRYIAGYNPGRSESAVRKAREHFHLPYTNFVVNMVGHLLAFIYEVVEQGRRVALREMLLASSEGQTEERLRERLLHYLQKTEYSEFLDQLVSAGDAGLQAISESFERDVVSPRVAEEIRGQVARYLESYPDHPGFLLLRALSEMYSRERSPDMARENVLAAVGFACDRYGVSEDQVFPFVAWALKTIQRRDPELASHLARALMSQNTSGSLARELLRQTPETLGGTASWHLLGLLMNQVNQLLNG